MAKRKKYQKINNDLQNTRQKIEQHETHWYLKVIAGAPKGLAVLLNMLHLFC
jgi:hypothetical protein